MKTKIILIIGLLLTVSLLIGMSNVSQAQKETEKMSAESGCSNATLSGKFAVIGNGMVPNGTSSTPQIPFANMTLMTLDGAGNLTNKVTVSRNGQILQNLDSGTYTVNTDCTGKMSITIPTAPFQLTFNLVTADLQGGQGKEFYFISTNNGGAVTHTAKRIQ